MKNHTGNMKIGPFPDLPLRNAGRRLIDNNRFSRGASDAGFAERYGRGNTSHTIHVWWARRPHTAMRALVFATLCKDTGDNADDILRDISLPDSEKIGDARRLLKEQYGRPPKVLDMFGGGGTIAFEAMNLGAEVSAIDTNELSVFIQKCNLEYSRDAGVDALRLLKESGHRVLARLEKESEPLFPLRSSQTIFGYLRTYSKTCGNCGFRYFLSKRPWLSRKKKIGLCVANESNAQVMSVRTLPDDYRHPSAWVKGKGGTRCPRCDMTEAGPDIRNCRDELTAMVLPAGGRGKKYVSGTADAIPGEDMIKRIESDALAYLGACLPISELPVWSGIVNPALYGIVTHSDFLNPRQRAMTVLLLKCLADEHDHLHRNASEALANYVTGMLSGLIDQLIDWNCRLSMWIPQNEQVGRAFCGPGVPMLWDYVETDPVSSGPGNLWKKLDRIIKGTRFAGRLPGRADVRHAHAQALPFHDGAFDAIVTDPPYYDNIFYSVLADFFYAWKRPLLKRIAPDLFANRLTDSSMELVASAHRDGTSDKAHENYCRQLQKAVSEASRVLKHDGVLSFVYSHGSLNGWDAFVRAFGPSDFVITGVHPLRIERRQRPRAMTSNAVNTCIVFVARKFVKRKFGARKQPIGLETFLAQFLEHCLEIVSNDVADGNWPEPDVAIALFASGAALIANTGEIFGTSYLDALAAVEKIIRKKMPGFGMMRRKSI